MSIIDAEVCLTFGFLLPASEGSTKHRFLPYRHRLLTTHSGSWSASGTSRGPRISLWSTLRRGGGKVRRDVPAQRRRPCARPIFFASPAAMANDLSSGPWLSSPVPRLSLATHWILRRRSSGFPCFGGVVDRGPPLHLFISSSPRHISASCYTSRVPLGPLHPPFPR